WAAVAAGRPRPAEPRESPGPDAFRRRQGGDQGAHAAGIPLDLPRLGARTSEVRRDRGCADPRRSGQAPGCRQGTLQLKPAWPEPAILCPPSRVAPAMHGILIVDKPRGPTSADVVAEVKRRLGADRVGHTGTLDPMATGVLPVAVGEGTKLAPFLIADDKAYE